MKNETYERELRYWSKQEPLWRELEGKTVMISGSSGMIGRCFIDLIMLHNHSLGADFAEQNQAVEGTED